MSSFREKLNPKKKFNLNLLEPKVIIQNNGGEYRTYTTPEGNKYPSITSVLGANPEKAKILQDWKDRVGEEEATKISKKATRNGTSIHNSLESYVYGENVYCSNPQYTAIKKVLDNSVDNVRGLEIPLYSDIIKIAGTADLLAEFDGILSVIDYKTSKKIKREEWITDYFIQSTFYALCVEELYGIMVPQIVIIVGVEGEAKAQVFVKKRREYVKRLVEARKLFTIIYNKGK